MISRHISRASAVLLFLGGIALLFASDTILPRLIPGFPPTGAWLGQLLGAGWLAVAALDWVGQSTLLGGIYGRSQVLANVTLHFVSASTLLRLVVRGEAPVTLWILAFVFAMFAFVYGWLLFRGPFERDFAVHPGAR